MAEENENSESQTSDPVTGSTEEATTTTATTEATKPEAGFLEEDDAAAAPKKDEKTVLDEDDDAEGDSDSDSAAFAADAIDTEDLTALVPEGFDVVEDKLKPFVEAVNGAGSRQEIVQLALTELGKIQSAAETDLIDAWNAEQKAKKEEIAADPALGGKNMQEARAKAKSVVERFGGTADQVAAVKATLSATGAGNHLSLFRLLNNIAAAIPDEATPVEGELQRTDATLAEKLFG